MTNTKPRTTEELMQWIDAHAFIAEIADESPAENDNVVSVADLRDLFEGMARIPATAHSEPVAPGIEAIANSIAQGVVQSLADSEPTTNSETGMELLRGTDAEGMFVLDGDSIQQVVANAIDNAVFDGVLALPARPSPAQPAESELPAWYGMDSPWPLHDVLSKLVEAAGILLDDKGYDGHGHETLGAARKHAGEILATLQSRPSTVKAGQANG